LQEAPQGAGLLGEALTQDYGGIAAWRVLRSLAVIP